jgi:hypothetical protein
VTSILFLVEMIFTFEFFRQYISHSDLTDTRVIFIPLQSLFLEDAKEGSEPLIALENVEIVNLQHNHFSQNIIPILFQCFPNAWWIDLSTNSLQSIDDVEFPLAIGSLDLRNNPKLKLSEFPTNLVSSHILRLSISPDIFHYSEDSYNDDWKLINRVILQLPNVWVFNEAFISLKEREYVLQTKFSTTFPKEPPLMNSNWSNQTYSLRQMLILHSVQSLQFLNEKNDFQKLDILLEEYLTEALIFNQYVNHLLINNNSKIKYIQYKPSMIFIDILLVLPHKIRLDLSVLLTVSIIFEIPHVLFKEALLLLLAPYYPVESLEEMIYLPSFVKTAIVSLLRRITKRELEEFRISMYLKKKRITTLKENQILLNEMKNLKVPLNYSNYHSFQFLFNIKYYLEDIHVISENKPAALLTADELLAKTYELNDLEKEILKKLPDVPTKWSGYKIFPTDNSPPLSPYNIEYANWISFATRHVIFLLNKCSSCPALTVLPKNTNQQNIYFDLLPILKAAQMTLSDLDITNYGPMIDGRSFNQKTLSKALNLDDSHQFQAQPGGLTKTNSNPAIDIDEMSDTTGSFKEVKVYKSKRKKRLEAAMLYLDGKILPFGEGLINGTVNQLVWNKENFNQEAFRNYQKPWNPQQEVVPEEEEGKEEGQIVEEEEVPPAGDNRAGTFFITGDQQNSSSPNKMERKPTFSPSHSFQHEQQSSFRSTTSAHGYILQLKEGQPLPANIKLAREFTDTLLTSSQSERNFLPFQNEEQHQQGQETMNRFHIVQISGNDHDEKMIQLQHQPQQRPKSSSGLPPSSPPKTPNLSSISGNIANLPVSTAAALPGVMSNSRPVSRSPSRGERFIQSVNNSAVGAAVNTRDSYFEELKSFRVGIDEISLMSSVPDNLPDSPNSFKTFFKEGEEEAARASLPTGFGERSNDSLHKGGGSLSISLPSISAEQKAAASSNRIARTGSSSPKLQLSPNKQQPPQQYYNIIATTTASSNSPGAANNNNRSRPPSRPTATATYSTLTAASQPLQSRLPTPDLDLIAIKTDEIVNVVESSKQAQNTIANLRKSMQAGQFDTQPTNTFAGEEDEKVGHSQEDYLQLEQQYYHHNQPPPHQHQSNNQTPQIQKMIPRNGQLHKVNIFSADLLMDSHFLLAPTQSINKFNDYFKYSMEYEVSENVDLLKEVSNSENMLNYWRSLDKPPVVVLNNKNITVNNAIPKKSFPYHWQKKGTTAKPRGTMTTTTMKGPAGNNTTQYEPIAEEFSTATTESKQEQAKHQPQGESNFPFVVSPSADNHNNNNESKPPVYPNVPTQQKHVSLLSSTSSPEQNRKKFYTDDNVSIDDSIAFSDITQSIAAIHKQLQQRQEEHQQLGSMELSAENEDDQLQQPEQSEHTKKMKKHIQEGRRISQGLLFTIEAIGQEDNNIEEYINNQSNANKMIHNPPVNESLELSEMSTSQELLRRQHQQYSQEGDLYSLQRNAYLPSSSTVSRPIFSTTPTLHNRSVTSSQNSSTNNSNVHTPFGREVLTPEAEQLLRDMGTFKNVSQLQNFNTFLHNLHLGKGGKIIDAVKKDKVYPQYTPNVLKNYITAQDSLSLSQEQSLFSLSKDMEGVEPPLEQEAHGIAIDHDQNHHDEDFNHTLQQDEPNESIFDPDFDLNTISEKPSEMLLSEQHESDLFDESKSLPSRKHSYNDVSQELPSAGWRDSSLWLKSLKSTVVNQQQRLLSQSMPILPSHSHFPENQQAQQQPIVSKNESFFMTDLKQLHENNNTADFENVSQAPPSFEEEAQRHQEKMEFYQEVVDATVTINNQTKQSFATLALRNELQYPYLYTASSWEEQPMSNDVNFHHIKRKPVSYYPIFPKNIYKIPLKNNINLNQLSEKNPEIVNQQGVIQPGELMALTTSENYIAMSDGKVSPNTGYRPPHQALQKNKKTKKKNEKQKPMKGSGQPLEPIQFENDILTKAPIYYPKSKKQQQQEQQKSFHQKNFSGARTKNLTILAETSHYFKNLIQADKEAGDEEFEEGEEDGEEETEYDDEYLDYADNNNNNNNNNNMNHNGIDKQMSMFSNLSALSTEDPLNPNTKAVVPEQFSRQISLTNSLTGSILTGNAPSSSIHPLSVNNIVSSLREKIADFENPPPSSNASLGIIVEPFAANNQKNAHNNNLDSASVASQMSFLQSLSEDNSAAPSRSSSRKMSTNAGGGGGSNTKSKSGRGGILKSAPDVLLAQTAAESSPKLGIAEVLTESSHIEKPDSAQLRTTPNNNQNKAEKSQRFILSGQGFSGLPLIHSNSATGRNNNEEQKNTKPQLIRPNYGNNNNKNNNNQSNSSPNLNVNTVPSPKDQQQQTNNVSDQRRDSFRSEAMSQLDHQAIYQSYYPHIITPHSNSMPK